MPVKSQIPNWLFLGVALWTSPKPQTPVPLKPIERSTLSRPRGVRAIASELFSGCYFDLPRHREFLPDRARGKAPSQTPRSVGAQGRAKNGCCPFQRLIKLVRLTAAPLPLGSTMLSPMQRAAWALSLAVCSVFVVLIFV